MKFLSAERNGIRPLLPFAGPERNRLTRCLLRLAPHLQEDGYALARGLAIEIHRARHGLPPSRKNMPDLDFVAASLDVVRPTIAEEFLVIHFHTPQPGYPKFLVMVADPISRMRIDIFPDREGALRSSLKLTELRLLSPGALLDHKLALLASASPKNPIDRKHLVDAIALADICGRGRPHVDDDCLGKDEYCQDLNSKCWKCDASSDEKFPLAPKARIFDILGYV